MQMLIDEKIVYPTCWDRVFLVTINSIKPILGSKKVQKHIDDPTSLGNIEVEMNNSVVAMAWESEQPPPYIMFHAETTALTSEQPLLYTMPNAIPAPSLLLNAASSANTIRLAAAVVTSPAVETSNVLPDIIVDRTSPSIACMDDAMSNVCSSSSNPQSMSTRKRKPAEVVTGTRQSKRMRKKKTIFDR